MSTENLTEAIIFRRDRRINIKLHKLRRQQSNNSGTGELQFIEHKSAPPIFEAGDDVSGLVSLEVNGGQPVAKIRLAIVCLSQVRWQTTNYGKRKSVINLLTGDDTRPGKENKIFFDRKVILQIDLGKNSETNKWTNGKHELPFRVQLPEDGLASTMTSCHGFIRYTVEVFTIDEDQNESRGEKEIVIVAPLQEKLDHHGRSVEKSMHILGSGKISLTGTLDRREYLPGEVIPVEVLTVNDSNIAVQPRVSLYQTQSFACNEVIRTLETCLTSEPFTELPVPPNQSATQIIKVPLATNLVVSLRSGLISVDYACHLSLDIPHAMDLNIHLPFVVTTRRARASGTVLHRSVSGHANGQVLDDSPLGSGNVSGTGYHSVACHQAAQQQQQTHPNVNGKNRSKVNNV